MKTEEEVKERVECFECVKATIDPRREAQIQELLWVLA